jgi:hypothetical protein
MNLLNRLGNRWPGTLTACVLAAVAVSNAAAGTLPLVDVLGQSNDLRAFDGEWIFVEDRTPNRPLEQQGPPMSGKFSIRTEAGAVILVSGHGSGHKDVRVAFDGTFTDVPKAQPGSFVRYKASWKDGVLAYETESADAAGAPLRGLIKKSFRHTAEGLLVTVELPAYSMVSTALYRHPQDIPMPAPAKATINDLVWLAGNWSGTRGTGGAISIEERWSPPKGGSMLATARTVARDRLTEFEFLRILEKAGGLVYIAQPNGAPPTEFILTEFTAKRAVFDNPRHDYPKRIVYELTPDGGLTATIGLMKGGTPQRFEFKREPN